MGWSAQDALKAYLNTLHLCKIHNGQDGTSEKMSKLVEPKCMVFISALAAGNQAKSMVEITSYGVTPLTIALAVAAMRMGGKLVCILSDQQAMERSNDISSWHGLNAEVEFVVGNACDVINKYKNNDLTVIDCKCYDYWRLFKLVDVNPRGSMILVNNLLYRRNNVSSGEVIEGKKIVKSVTFLIGEGMELTRIGSFCNSLCSNSC